jgi:putative flippase GtrA
LTKDILAVGRRAAEAPGSLVLGARAFSGDVPLRSRLGNAVTGIVFRLFIGQSVTDTQTGLRAIPRSLMPALLRVKASGYEFELEMLILSARSKVPIESVTIQTVYLDNNASSHFDPIRDSARIYFVFVRFISSSALTALLDNLVFAIAFQASQSLVASMVLGRLVASAFNFAVNKRLVFHSKELFWKVLAKYVSLVIVLGSIAFALIHFLVAQYQWNAYAAKLVVEGVLLLCSFVLQRDVVFAEKSPPISAREPEATGPRT